MENVTFDSTYFFIGVLIVGLLFALSHIQTLRERNTRLNNRINYGDDQKFNEIQRLTRNMSRAQSYIGNLELSVDDHKKLLLRIAPALTSTSVDEVEWHDQLEQLHTPTSPNYE